MASHLISEPPTKRLRHEEYAAQTTPVLFEIAGTQDSQLAYLENNLPEELFDTATGRAWVNTWNQDTREPKVLVKSSSGSCLERTEPSVAADASAQNEVQASTSQQYAEEATSEQTSRAPSQCNVSIQTDSPFSDCTSSFQQSAAPRSPNSDVFMPPEIKMFAQQQMLLVLLHALKCEQQKSTDTQGQNMNPPCTRPICGKMKGVLTHLRNCRVARSCPEHFCSFTRSILMHFRSCKLSSCSLCVPVKQLCVNNPSASLEWLLYQLRANAGLLLSDLRNLATAAKTRPAVPKTPAKAPVIPTCSICMDRLISTIVFPCRHFFCEQCAPMIFKCGLCRETIRSKHRVFF